MATTDQTINFHIGSTRTLFSLPISKICSYSAYFRHQITTNNHNEFFFPKGNLETFEDLFDWINKSGPATNITSLELSTAVFTRTETWRLILLFLLCERFEIPLLQNQIVNILAGNCIKYWVPFHPSQIDHVFDDKNSKPTSLLRRLLAKLTTFFWGVGAVDRDAYGRCIHHNIFQEHVEIALKEIEEGGPFEMYTWMDSLCAFHHHEDGETCEGLNVIPVGPSVGNYEAPPLAPRRRAGKGHYKKRHIKRTRESKGAGQKEDKELDDRGRWPWAWWDKEAWGRVLPPSLVAYRLVWQCTEGKRHRF